MFSFLFSPFNFDFMNCCGSGNSNVQKSTNATNSKNNKKSTKDRDKFSFPPMPMARYPKSTDYFPEPATNFTTTNTSTCAESPKKPFNFRTFGAGGIATPLPGPGIATPLPNNAIPGPGKGVVATPSFPGNVTSSKIQNSYSNSPVRFPPYRKGYDTPNYLHDHTIDYSQLLSSSGLRLPQIKTSSLRSYAPWSALPNEVHISVSRGVFMVDELDGKITEYPLEAVSRVYLTELGAGPGAVSGSVLLNLEFRTQSIPSTVIGSTGSETAAALGGGGRRRVRRLHFQFSDTKRAGGIAEAIRKFSREEQKTVISTFCPSEPGSELPSEYPASEFTSSTLNPGPGPQSGTLLGGPLNNIDIVSNNDNDILFDSELTGPVDGDLHYRSLENTPSTKCRGTPLAVKRTVNRATNMGGVVMEGYYGKRVFGTCSGVFVM